MVFSILLFFVGGGVETIHGLKCRQVRAKHIPKPVVLDLDGLAQSRQNDPKLRQKKGDHSPKNFKHPVYLNVINSENMSLTYIPTFPNRLYHGKFASQFHLAPFFKIRRWGEIIQGYLSFSQMASWKAHIWSFVGVLKVTYIPVLPKTKVPRCYFHEVT